MTKLNKAYEPKDYEKLRYQEWEASGFFNPDNLLGKRKEVFSIAMPPANVTGVLHLGHALENTLMDLEVRYQRLLGKKALLIPGTDHAAVATQAKVEKMLIKEQGYKNPRQELGRKKLLEVIKDYADKSQETILGQIRSLGTSCDWSRLAYTFDDNRNRAVNEAFIRMYNDGLIYRGHRAINWSVKGQSTCSDDEIVYQSQTGKLYTFKYSKDFPIPVASTRPETKLGDTAVAVHPQDKRYQAYIGQTFEVEVGASQPLKIKIIADSAVDPKFGTGAVGVTPAHSLTDYEMFLNHHLELIQVIGQDGRMTEEAGKNYQGLTTHEARDKFIQWLKDQDLLIKEEEIEQNVGTSDRFGDIVEILPMTQWFVDVNKKIKGKNKSLKELMKESVTVGHNHKKDQTVEILPERFTKLYLQWIDNLRDWCISRQIWWGHRLPVWYKGEEVKVGVVSPGEGWHQDEDTLDTWFSSALWTFATLGWPDKTSELKNYHPTSWMQMGYEILFFWMARMILMSTYLLDQIPFKTVYFHGLLRNKDGQKFSKSLGTGIDPLAVVERYGADALRLSLVKGITPGGDAKFYEEKVAGSRNFVNKLWNISRFILSSVDNVARVEFRKIKIETLADQWILFEFNSLVERMTEFLDRYKFSQASEELYEFTWSKLADWYLEIAKIEKGKDQILLYILERLLILWHPFCPFVTETLWQEFETSELLMVQKWPEAERVSKSGLKDFMIIQELVTAIRTAKAENGLALSQAVNCQLTGPKSKLIASNQVLVEGLARVKLVDKSQGLKLVIAGLEVILDIKADQALLIARSKAADNLTSYINSLKNKLASKEFVKKAPAEVVEAEQVKLKEAEDKLSKLT